MNRTSVLRRDPVRAPLTVSVPHEPAERQADRAADVVAGGGSVAGWSFGQVPLQSAVHRDVTGTPPRIEPTKAKSDEAKLEEGVEAALETKAGQQLKQTIMDLPPVKAVIDALGSTPGKLAIGAGVAGLYATSQPLPIQAPAFPIKRFPGLSAKVIVEGPLDAPTFVGVSLTFTDPGPKDKRGPSTKQRIAADTARLRAQAELFTPQAEKDRTAADDQAAIAWVVAQQQARFGKSTLIPVLPGAKPTTVDVPKQEPPEAKEEEQKKNQDAPVQRAPATTTESADTVESLDTSGIDGAIRGGGRPIDPAVRHSMEARFGFDFASVRLHDGPAAASAARGVGASAFTVGEHIVFGAGGYDPSTGEGRHLLAHELAHTIQQRGSRSAKANDAAVRIHRRGLGEWHGTFFGTAEGPLVERPLPDRRDPK